MKAIIATVLMIFGTTAAQAQQKIFEAWAVGTSTAGPYSSTVNDSGDLFGKWCSYADKNCKWLLGIQIQCNPNNKIPILANTNDTPAAAPLFLACIGPLPGSTNGYYRLEFTNWQVLENLLKGASQIGFAVPMSGGSFKVVRFSLVGESDSDTYLTSNFFSPPSSTPAPAASGQSTRDTTL